MSSFLAGFEEKLCGKKVFFLPLAISSVYFCTGKVYIYIYMRFMLVMLEISLIYVW